MVQNEPADWVDADTVGLFAAIGIRKGQPFAPDARMKKTLTEAVAVGNAYARANAFASRDPRTRIFKDRQWLTPFVGGSYEFLSGAERLLDAEAMFFYLATGITPAMSESKPGTGSAYALAFRDAKGNYLDGGRTYKMTLPGPIPVVNFWAFTVYDNQTRSLLPNRSEVGGHGQQRSGIEEERGRRRDHLVRTEGARRKRSELGADDAGQGLQPHSAALWTAGTVVQPDLATGRSRIGELVMRRDGARGRAPGDPRLFRKFVRAALSDCAGHTSVGFGSTSARGSGTT